MTELEALRWIEEWERDQEEAFVELRRDTCRWWVVMHTSVDQTEYVADRLVDAVCQARQSVEPGWSPQPMA